jgi:hypothetical protein
MGVRKPEQPPPYVPTEDLPACFVPKAICIKDIDSALTVIQEHTERRWPDDFRGFGTNVRPAKQK